MDKVQSGVIAEASSDALFVTLKVNREKISELKSRLSLSQKTIADLKARFPDAQLHAVIAIGSEFWPFLSDRKPALLTSFPQCSSAIEVPSTPVDLLLHLRSNRHDVTYELAVSLMKLLGDCVSLEEEIHGFRYLDMRDLTGFVDGTENPQDQHKQEVAVVGEEDPEFSGGSYIHLQRYIHDLACWSQQTTEAQEDTYGRTKEENIEYASDQKAATAHTKRTSLKDSQGNSVEILRHSMPYGNLMESGLMFASYCRTPENFTLMIRSMVEGDGAGNTDRLMQFTRAVTGQAFFAPSVVWFQEIGATN